LSNILQEQIQYYRARSAEYDEWFYRQGRFDHGESENKLWFDETAQVRELLLTTPKQAHILELAPGTGIWTQELLKISDFITAVDASPEMIAINKAKVQSDKVTYVQADLFQWQAEQEYDMIFFGFWLSHVPPEKLDTFLEMVFHALKPNGYFFMVDSKNKQSSTAKDHTLPSDGVIMKRTLNDGSNFEIIKVYYQGDELEQALARNTIIAEAKFTENFFIYAQGRKSAE
jgi:demethylmenaquinone methyltransferase/2-methoxy-6-polyprenyl-1,4-benzoquinol methylase